MNAQEKDGVRPEREVVIFQCGPDQCQHEFGGWREFDDGRGGEQFCKKCGMGAMAHSLWNSE